MNKKSKYDKLSNIKKKGGIIIYKKLFFLITIISTFIIGLFNVHAESATFYEAEYIDNIYMSKYNYSANYIYYQKARFFRKYGSNEFAYCIEPFNFFNEGSTYESTINPRNLSDSQKQRISRIAHFGYGYNGHNDVKWYAITQIMIWQTADPNSGSYFFTDSLNGNKIYPYENEINEINHLVDTYDNLPINNQTYSTYEEGNLIIDGGEMLKYYSANDDRIKIEGNKIIIDKLKEGNYDFSLTRNDNNYNHPIIFYQANNSQNMIQTGNLENKTATFHVNSYKTSITINKIDKDTQEFKAQGEASLNGSIFQIYNDKGDEIKEITIKDNKGLLENIDFGKYYIKEIKPGEGYLLNDKKYEIEISSENPQQEITIENQVITKNIKIIKKYENNKQLNGEANISFDIYDINNNLIKTVITNEQGEVMFNLPYGTYNVIQKNSTPGYYKVDPFKIIVENNEDENIELTDYRIPVPNTHTNNYKLIIYILELIIYII